MGQNDESGWHGKWAESGKHGQSEMSQTMGQNDESGWHGNWAESEQGSEQWVTAIWSKWEESKQGSERWVRMTRSEWGESKQWVWDGHEVEFVGLLHVWQYGRDQASSIYNTLFYTQSHYPHIALTSHSHIPIMLNATSGSDKYQWGWANLCSRGGAIM